MSTEAGAVEYKWEDHRCLPRRDFKPFGEMLNLVDWLVITWNLFSSTIHRVNIITGLGFNLVWSLGVFKGPGETHLLTTPFLLSSQL